MNLNSLRKDVDRIDEKILALIKKRLELAEKIAFFKKNKGLPIKDGLREKDVYKKTEIIAKSLKLEKGLIKKIFDLIIRQSLKVQENIYGRLS